MTTDMRYTYVDDVSVKNEVLFVNVDLKPKLAAGTWASKVSGPISQVRINSLREVFRKLSKGMPGWEFWLIGGHGTTQPNNRIVRFNGFWKSLQKANVKIPTGEFLDDTMADCGNGLRFFGAVRLGFDQSENVDAVMRAAQAAVAFLPKVDGAGIVTSLLEKKWRPTNVKPPKEILETICGHSGVVVDTYGEFDDPEVLVAGFGKKEVLADLSLN